MKLGITALAPVRILFEYDGPRVFTCHDQFGDLTLAYQCEESAGALRFLLVPFDEQLEDRLTSGSITVLEAIDQPRLFLATTDFDFQVVETRRVQIESVPYENLPKPGVMLWPDLQPLLRLRVSAAGISEGVVPRKVVTEVFDKADAALKYIIQFAGERLGIAETEISKLCDLPAQRFAYGSFEVSFRAPEINTDDRPQIAENAEAVYKLASELLRAGIDMAQVEARLTDEEAAADTGERLAAARAAKALAPSNRSIIDVVQVFGTLAEKPGSRPASLNKHSHKNAVRAIKKLRQPKRPASPKQFRGWIKVIKDSKPYQFALYLREDNSKIAFELDAENEQLWGEVADAIKTHREVIVSGKPKPKSTRLIAIAIHPPSEDVDSNSATAPSPPSNTV